MAPRTLAFEYLTLLKKNLSADQFYQIMEKGAHPDQYIDANMILEEAFIKGMGRESDLSNDSDLALMNEAIRFFHNNFCLINSNIV
jgi:hypothetical protein